jgi:hypothetical protein
MGRGELTRGPISDVSIYFIYSMLYFDYIMHVNLQTHF